MDFLKIEAREFVQQIRRAGVEMIWSADDRKRSVLCSIVPCAVSFGSFLSIYNDQNAATEWKTAAKPFWALSGPRIYGLMDMLTMAPLGYAAYRVYKYGGGFNYYDTAAALGLFGGSLLFSLFSLPITQPRNHNSLFRNTFRMHMLALGAAYTFRKIDHEAGMLILPYAIWTGFYALLTYAMK